MSGDWRHEPHSGTTRRVMADTPRRPDMSTVGSGDEPTREDPLPLDFGSEPEAAAMPGGSSGAGQVRQGPSKTALLEPTEDNPAYDPGTHQPLGADPAESAPWNKPGATQPGEPPLFDESIGSFPAPPGGARATQLGGDPMAPGGAP